MIKLYRYKSLYIMHRYLSVPLSQNYKGFSKKMIEKIVIYTDGSCKNKGTGFFPGGYGCFLQYHFKNNRVVNIELFGGEKETTNNRMEITAVLEALEFRYKSKNEAKTFVISDSAYVVNSFGLKDGKITGWIMDWIKKDWKTKKGERVNRDLLEKLYTIIDKNKENLSLDWVKGHDGNIGNERADFLANLGALELSKSEKKKI